MAFMTRVTSFREKLEDRESSPCRARSAGDPESGSESDHQRRRSELPAIPIGNRIDQQSDIAIEQNGNPRTQLTSVVIVVGPSQIV